MSAKTRPASAGNDLARRTEQTERISSLFVTALDLSRRNKRSLAQTDILVRAMQLFKDGTLGRVESRACAEITNPDQIRSVLSLDLASAGFSERACRYLKKRGIRYVGETYRLSLDRRAEICREVEETVVGVLGLPNELNLGAVGWNPPYWSDQNFLNAMSLPLSSAVRDNVSTTHFDNYGQGRRFYFGDTLCARKDADRSPSFMLEHRNRHSQLFGWHSAAIRQDDWTPPTPFMPADWVSKISFLYLNTPHSTMRDWYKDMVKQEGYPIELLWSPSQLEISMSFSRFFGRWSVAESVVDLILRGSGGREKIPQDRVEEINTALAAIHPKFRLNLGMDGLNAVLRELWEEHQKEQASD